MQEEAVQQVVVLNDIDFKDINPELRDGLPRLRATPLTITGQASAGSLPAINWRFFPKLLVRFLGNLTLSHLIMKRSQSWLPTLIDAGMDTGPNTRAVSVTMLNCFHHLLGLSVAFLLMLAVGLRWRYVRSAKASASSPPPPLPTILFKGAAGAVAALGGSGP
ncbi:hypothetical protein HaLaN_02265 [Haematococcus lacustris]|uniref:Uncharacterized protein n=1 Tax=Haematococcus lacustris TaxID=44745 RepID=A0A699YDL6_HAELA|nr:hypothetical protein HaLaN_02265 [Haematococcus lacustris]